MNLCGGCRPKPPETLFHIRQGYRARWQDLLFSVEEDASQWTLRVHDSSHSAALYTAHRGGAEAARLAAADFASFRGNGNPELSWRPYW